MVEVLGKPGAVGTAVVTFPSSPRALRFLDGLPRHQDTQGHAIAIFKYMLLETKRLKIKDWSRGT